MSFEHIHALSRAGNFTAALKILQSDRLRLQNVDPELSDAIESELSYETGRDHEAVLVSTRRLGRNPKNETCARLLRVLALCSFNRGDIGASNEYLNRAINLKCVDKRIHASVELTRLVFAFSFESLDSVSARLPQLKRSVLRAGDPHLIALLRILVARYEIRRGGFAEATRHHRVVATILEQHRNLWLSGLLEVDSSVGWVLLGDLDSAHRCAQAALRLSEESGHFHTKVASQVNLSHILERKGRFDDAKRQIDAVTGSIGDDPHLLRAVTDSWANLLITSRDYSSSRLVLDEAASRAERDGESRPAWDVISEYFSRARLHMAEGEWQKAANTLTQAITHATTSGDHAWLRRLILTRCRMSAISGKTDFAAADLSKISGGECEPQGLAEYYAALGAVLLRTNGRLQQARESLTRAARIAFATSNVGLAGDLTHGLPSIESNEKDHLERLEVAPDLDSAVALLELAGHPHVLGPEAFALIDATACAEAVALVTAGPAGRRVVQCSGWTASEAAAATSGVEELPIGRRSEETWTLVVRPKRALESFCAFAAIRKLLAFAVSLEGYRRDEKQRAALWPADALDSDPECIWASEQMAEQLTIARRIAPTPLSVLVTGETGTGKEMIARAIHRASDRADHTFLPFNCAAVPRDMLESQLFGYRRGAFTGADASFPGVIRSAAGGTLFLDEIGEIGLDVQPKLLRFLETHEIHPLGEPQPIKVDVRIVAATNASVEQLVAAGRFREDLFYRLNIVRLSLPPLRERREEIPPLVQYYLRKYSDEQRKGQLTLSDETLEYLLLFSWPGNVRQLANEVRRIVALAEPDAAISPSLLSPEIQASRRTIPAAPAPDVEARVALDQPLPAAVEMLEQMMVRRALDRTHGRVEEASRLLGISRKGLFLKRRRWGLSHAS